MRTHCALRSTLVTLRPVHVSIPLLWPSSSYPLQRATGRYPCMYLPGLQPRAQHVQSSGGSPLQWRWPTQPQVWLPTPFEPHCMLGSLYNLHYASGLVTSVEDLGSHPGRTGQQCGIWRFLVGPTTSLIAQDALQPYLPSTRPLYLGVHLTVLPLSPHGILPLSTCKSTSLSIP